VKVWTKALEHVAHDRVGRFPGARDGVHVVPRPPACRRGDGSVGEKSARGVMACMRRRGQLRPEGGCAGRGRQVLKAAASRGGMDG
jgi:hypothetical protein